MSNRLALGPVRPYLTTALDPMSLSTAMIGPFMIDTVVPGKEEEIRKIVTKQARLHGFVIHAKVFSSC